MGEFLGSVTGNYISRQNISTHNDDNRGEKDRTTSTIVDKQKHVLLKVELGRTSAEVRCLDAPIALLKKLNKRLEKENDKKKSSMPTLRLQSDETLRKLTQPIFRSRRNSRTALQNVAAIHHVSKPNVNYSFSTHLSQNCMIKCII